MVTPRRIGTHHHAQSNVIGDLTPTDPGAPVENGVFGLVKRLENNEGADLALGDVVKIDTSGDELIEKTETLADPLVLGVVAAAGPFVNGARTPVLISGYHPAVKVTGAVAAGDYLVASATDGTAEAQTPGGAGSFARAVTAAAGGVVAAVIFDPNLSAAVDAFTDLSDVPSTYAGAGLQAVRVNAGATGLEFVNFPASGSIKYDPRRAPASPNSVNDEFDDLSLAGAWTTTSSGGGSSGTVSETDRKGFLHTRVVDGGAGSGRGAYKTFSPAAGMFTVCAHVYGNVRNAGSNQCNLILYTSAGGFLFAVGMLNGTQAIINHAGGFSGHNVTYITGNVGEIWLMIQRDGSTGIDGHISGDGHIWTRLTGATVAGTVGRASLEVTSFASSYAEGWWEFLRVFPGVQTFDIGGTP